MLGTWDRTAPGGMGRCTHKTQCTCGQGGMVQHCPSSHRGLPRSPVTDALRCCQRKRLSPTEVYRSRTWTFILQAEEKSLGILQFRKGEVLGVWPQPCYPRILLSVQLPCMDSHSVPAQQQYIDDCLRVSSPAPHCLLFPSLLPQSLTVFRCLVIGRYFSTSPLKRQE